jgi:hypothetical protein
MASDGLIQLIAQEQIQGQGTCRWKISTKVDQGQGTGGGRCCLDGSTDELAALVREHTGGEGAMSALNALVDGDYDARAGRAGALGR